MASQLIVPEELVYSSYTYAEHSLYHVWHYLLYVASVTILPSVSTAGEQTVYHSLPQVNHDLGVARREYFHEPQSRE